jgi:hypothetical protein
MEQVFGDGTQLSITFQCPKDQTLESKMAAKVILPLRDQSKFGEGIEQAYLLTFETISACFPKTDKGTLYWLVRMRPNVTIETPSPLWKIYVSTTAEPSRLQVSDGGVTVKAVECLTCDALKNPIAKIAAAAGAAEDTLFNSTVLKTRNDPDVLPIDLRLVRSLYKPPLFVEDAVTISNITSAIKATQADHTLQNSAEPFVGGIKSVVATQGQLAINSTVSLDISIVSNDNKRIMTIQLEGMIVAAHPKSELAENTGTVYSVDPINIKGLTVADESVFAFAPTRFAGHKMRYWLVVYPDNVDNKVIVTLDSTPYIELIGHLDQHRLAEYPVLKISTK